MFFAKLNKLFQRPNRRQPDHIPNETPQIASTEPIAQANLTWESGITEEVLFWQQWLSTRGGQWPEDFQFRFAPNSQLQAHIREALPIQTGATIKILDVGAGPLTCLGKQWEGYSLRITAVDPLAEEYDKLLDQYQLTPPVRTQKGFAERLVAQFGENHFDLVHARNCIDHSDDPCRAIQAMVAVAKPGGLVYMDHSVNEAKAQNFQGFHQWNLFCKDGDLYVANRTQAINVSRRLAAVADVETRLFDEGIWMANLIRKRSS